MGKGTTRKRKTRKYCRRRTKRSKRNAKKTRKNIRGGWWWKTAEEKINNKFKKRYNYFYQQYEKHRDYILNPTIMGKYENINILKPEECEIVSEKCNASFNSCIEFLKDAGDNGLDRHSDHYYNPKYEREIKVLTDNEEMEMEGNITLANGKNHRLNAQNGCWRNCADKNKKKIEEICKQDDAYLTATYRLKPQYLSECKEESSRNLYAPIKKYSGRDLKNKIEECKGGVKKNSILTPEEEKALYNCEYINPYSFISSFCDNALNDDLYNTHDECVAEMNKTNKREKFRTGKMLSLQEQEEILNTIPDDKNCLNTCIGTGNADVSEPRNRLLFSPTSYVQSFEQDGSPDSIRRSSIRSGGKYK